MKDVAFTRRAFGAAIPCLIALALSSCGMLLSEGSGPTAKVIRSNSKKVGDQAYQDARNRGKSEKEAEIARQQAEDADFRSTAFLGGEMGRQMSSQVPSSNCDSMAHRPFKFQNSHSEI